MKPSKNRALIYDSSPLNGARDRCIFGQRPVRSDVIVIASIGSQDPAQMCLAQDDEMIHALAPDRSDQPFGKGILQRRGWRGRLVPDSHGAHSARDNAAVDPNPIADEVAWRLIPRECLG